MTRIARIHLMTIALAGLLLQPLYAQTADAVGHYEGAISSPAGDLPLQIDFIQSASGAVVGTLTIPSQKLQGFPLTNVSLKGKDVEFDIATSGGGYFRGERQGHHISGDFSTQMGPFPLDLERTGDARTYALPPSARIGKELEGEWKGVLEVDGGMHVVVSFANQADGTSSGTMVSVDENNLTIPLVIVQDGATLHLTLPMVGSSYVGTLNPERTEVIGTYTTSRGQALPLTLKR